MPALAITDFTAAEIPISQLDRSLTTTEESGVLSRELGLLPARSTQVGCAFLVQRDHRHVAFVHPPLRSTPPKPSARRAAPRRPEMCA